MFGKLKILFVKLKEVGSSAISAASSVANNDKVADGIMRWPRIVAFFMIVAMFFIGWSNPATLLAFAQAISALPGDFWTIVYIILGSIGATKLSTDIIKVITSRK